jgi:hypothetical protein
VTFGKATQFIASSDLALLDVKREFAYKNSVDKDHSRVKGPLFTEKLSNKVLTMLQAY